MDPLSIWPDMVPCKECGGQFLQFWSEKRCPNCIEREDINRQFLPDKGTEGLEIGDVVTMTKHSLTLTEDSEERKTIPLTTGVLDYFPAALAAVAKVSEYGNRKHNPGQSLRWSRDKSTDHADCILRHLADRGAKDNEGIRHSAYVAWRALALLQEELEAEGATPGRGSVFPDEAPTVQEPLTPTTVNVRGKSYHVVAERVPRAGDLYVTFGGGYVLPAQGNGRNVDHHQNDGVRKIVEEVK